VSQCWLILAFEPVTNGEGGDDWNTFPADAKLSG
jgi:hypothetical protein